MKPKQPLKTKTPLQAKVGLPTSRKPLPKRAAKPTKPPTSRPVSKLKKDADQWWSLAVRYRFASANKRTFGEWFVECVTCGTELPVKKMQNGHFMSRQYNSTRYHEQNCAPQCYGCNVMHQGRQYEFGMALDDLYGAGTAKRMHDLAKVPHQFKREELLTIIAEAKEEVRGYQEK